MRTTNETLSMRRAPTISLSRSGPHYVHCKWNTVNGTCTYHLAISSLAGTSLRRFPEPQKPCLYPASAYDAAPDLWGPTYVNTKKRINTFHTTGAGSLGTTNRDCSALSSLLNNAYRSYTYASTVRSCLFGRSSKSES